MIIGNGLIAKAFSEFRDYENIIVFASGVSNSLETDDSFYSREENLLLNTIAEMNNSVRLVYFSTISIYDESINKSKYIKHKLKMESLITKKVKNYNIFRLPNVVGHSNNPYTLTNFFYSKLKLKESFFVYSEYYRYLIDVKDASSICSYIIKDEKYRNQIININLNNRISAIDIVRLIEKVLNTKGIYQVLTKKNDFFIESEITSIAKKLKIEPTDYNFRLIEKYYTQNKF